jgi:hypothetical protein
MSQLYRSCSYRSCSLVPPNRADRIDAESTFEADSVRYTDRIDAESTFEADSVRYTDRIDAESTFEADSVRWRFQGGGKATGYDFPPLPLDRPVIMGTLPRLAAVMAAVMAAEWAAEWAARVGMRDICYVSG